MSRAPTHLRAVADALRSAARALTADVADLDGHVGPATWEGPAADVARRRARGVASGATEAGDDLRAVAARLDAEADAIDARDRAEAQARAQQVALAAALARDVPTFEPRVPPIDLDLSDFEPDVPTVEPERAPTMAEALLGGARAGDGR